MPPYTLGAWLGDGTSAAAQITTADPEIIMRIEAEGSSLVPSVQLDTDINYGLPAYAAKAPRALMCRLRHDDLCLKPLRCGHAVDRAADGHKFVSADTRGRSPTCLECNGPS